MSRSNLESSVGRVRLRFFKMILIALLLGGCVYRFTNLHVKPPQGIRAIAVEAVYDTTRNVLPHHLLWQNVQKEIALDGHLALVSQDEAEALLRLHLKWATLTPVAESTVGNTDKKDPKVLDVENPPNYRKFNVLPRAGRAATKEVITILVETDLWNLKTGEEIFKRTYSMRSVDYPARHNSQDLEQVIFPWTMEAYNSQFDEITKRIGRRIVTDLLVRL